MSSAASPALTCALPGLEKVKRYWDKKHQVYVARILPGEYYVTTAKEMISTVLGSCVSACIRDIKAGVGGMNHFMLPQDSGQALGSEGCVTTSTRYGSYAMEHMINDILANGGRRENLEIKLFGGGGVLPSMTNVGSRNIKFVHEYLRMEGFPIAAEDLGGNYPRKVLYFPVSGRALMRKMPIARPGKHERREMDYQKSLQSSPVAGEIDLF